MTLFLTDENISPTIVQFLRDRGFSVKDVAEEGMSGVDDAAIMNFARQEGRALITFDKHFANILLYPPSSHCGVVRIRIHPPLLSDIIQALDNFLQQFNLATIRGALVILERDGFRVRRTP
jgi:predicted nuclease of predicted toxin-antitoxin system